MKIELIIIGITIFFMVNTYYDGKLMDKVKSFKKYYQIAGIGFIGLSAYLFLKKNPNNSRGIIKDASELIKHMPIDHASGDYITPILNLYNNNINPLNSPTTTSQDKRMMNSGLNANNKRSVSETKKKYVAAQQQWKCGRCSRTLPSWFEVDHKVRLDSGGSNHIDNLVALCRDCHGEKTAFENL